MVPGYDLAMALSSPPEQRSIDDRVVVAWRFAELQRVGFDERLSLELAMSPDVELDLAISLVEQRCPLDTALRIVR